MIEYKTISGKWVFVEDEIKALGLARYRYEGVKSKVKSVEYVNAQFKGIKFTLEELKGEIK